MPDIMTGEAEEVAQKLIRDKPQRPNREKFAITTKQGRDHLIVKVSYRGQHVGQYGIQRASKKKRHNYIAEQLHVTRGEAYDLAKCPLSVDDYIDILEARGELARTNE